MRKQQAQALAIYRRALAASPSHVKEESARRVLRRPSTLGKVRWQHQQDEKLALVTERAAAVAALEADLRLKERGRRATTRQELLSTMIAIDGDSAVDGNSFNASGGNQIQSGAAGMFRLPQPPPPPGERGGEGPPIRSDGTAQERRMPTDPRRRPMSRIESRIQPRILQLVHSQTRRASWRQSLSQMQTGRRRRSSTC
jgi:hypothetical protein